VLTLIERAEAAFGRDKAAALQERTAKHGLTLEDFLEQMQAVRRMGPLDQILSLIPGLPGKAAAGKAGGLPQPDERDLARVEAIIRSMTAEERRHPEIIKDSRRRRIASGSGTAVQDVNRLLRQFEEIRRLMRGLSQGRLPAGLAAKPGVPGLPPPLARRHGHPAGRRKRR